MTKRIITGLLALGIWLLLLYINSFPLFWLAITATFAIGLNEYFTMTLQNAGKIFQSVFLFCGLLPLFAAFSGRADLVNAGLILAFIILCILVIQTYSSSRDPFNRLIKSCFGVFYAGFLPAHLVLMMTFEKGGGWLLFLTAITAASDTGAYFTGKSLGRHPLCPAVSPKKTIEGFGGGLLAGVVCGTVVASFLLPATHQLYPVVLAALLLSCLGVIGDLTESVIKRAMNIKDSGQILPGHGGILDRTDSLLITAPACFYLLQFKVL